MSILQNSPSINHYHTIFLNSFPQLQKQQTALSCCRRRLSLMVRAQQAPISPNWSSSQDRPGRRSVLAAGLIASLVSLINQNSASCLCLCIFSHVWLMRSSVGGSSQDITITFFYLLGNGQEVVIEGEDKVFKDVIEPLESVSVNLVPTSKQNIRDFGPPQQVAETLIKKVLAPPNQKTKLVEATEHDVDGKIYYTFEFIAQAPNYTRHALSAICIGNGKFYTLTTGANERRWEKMKDKLRSVVDSFKIIDV